MKTKLTTLLLLIIEFACAQKATDSVMTVFGGLTNGSLTKEQILKADSLQLYVRSDLKNINARVLSFSLRANFNGIHADIPNVSNKLSEKQIELVTKYLHINQSLYIENIKVSVNGQTITANEIKVKIKGPEVFLSDHSSPTYEKYKTILDPSEVRPIFEKQFLGSEVTIPKKVVLENDFLNVSNDDKIDKNIQVTEYSFKASNSENEIAVKGDKLTSELKKIVQSLKYNDSVRFYKIKAITSDGKTVDVGAYTINLTN